MEEEDDEIIFGFDLMMLVVIGVGACCICICCYGIFKSYTRYQDTEFDDGFFSKVQRRVSRIVSIPSQGHIRSTSEFDSMAAGNVELQDYVTLFFRLCIV